jgi:hypothetical protein
LSVVGLGAQPAAALRIDFGVAPVPDGPARVLTVGGITLTGQNGAFEADVQRNAKGLGVASGQNFIQGGETAILSFEDTIVLEGFALWFQGANTVVPDQFDVELDGVLVPVAATSGPLEFLPATGADAGNGRWFTFEVVGTRTGDVLAITGGSSAAFRVKDVTVAVPEPTGATLMGLGFVLVLRSLRRQHPCK